MIPDLPQRLRQMAEAEGDESISLSAQGAAEALERLRAGVRVLDRLYARDGVASANARDIERVFDDLLHGDRSVIVDEEIEASRQPSRTGSTP